MGRHPLAGSMTRHARLRRGEAVYVEPLAGLPRLGVPPSRVRGVVQRPGDERILVLLEGDLWPYGAGDEVALPARRVQRRPGSAHARPRRRLLSRLTFWRH